MLTIILTITLFVVTPMACLSFVEYGLGGKKDDHFLYAGLGLMTVSLFTMYALGYIA